MKWNAFSVFEDVFANTKSLIMPFSFKKWLKLGFIGWMSDFSSSGGGSGNTNFNPGSSNPQGMKATGNFIKELGLPPGIAYLILGLIGIFLIIALLFSYLKGVFTFIFLNALEKKDMQIIKNYKKYHHQGISFFMFKIVYSVITILLLVAIASPFIYNIISNWSSIMVDPASVFSGINPIITVLVIFLFILYFLALGIFWSFVMNFSVIHMYFKKENFTKSFTKTLFKLKNQKKEFLLFLLARIVISIIVSILMVLSIIILLIPFLIIGFIFFIPVFFFPLFIPISIIVAILLFIIFLLCCIVILAPFLTFKTYHSLACYKKFMK
ncbi:MAG: hypothetical protein V1740_04190 [Candidatus Woesearchaeota archaeon]